MRLLLITVSFILVVLSPLQGQRQADNWVAGICNGNGICSPPYGTTIVKFNDFSIESITNKYFNFRINKGSASISDSLGNLLLVFNGKHLFDSSGAIIDSFYIADFSGMPVGYKSSLFLNVPGHPKNYCLFNSYAKPIFDDPFFLAYDTSFYYSEFRKTDNEIETLIRKQPIELDSSASGTIAAVRHANGRDWWIVKSSVYQDKFYQALLDPSGFEFYPVFTPIPHLPQPGGGWNLFSSNGSKFVNIIIGSIRKAYVYDFDRCTGEITNPVEHDMSDILSIDNYNPNCLSPDGTKLYVLGEGGAAFFSRKLLQYDFNTGLTTYITDVNGGPSTTPYNLHVIVASAIDTTEIPFIPRLNVIYNPNAAGLECDNEESVYDLLNYGFIDVSPNCANFRLGALAGSPCDTLFTWLSNMKNFNFKIYPNPVESSLTIELEKASLNELRITDMLGRTVWRGKTNEQKTVLSKEIEKLNQGIYWLEINYLETGERGGSKFIRQ